MKKRKTAPKKECQHDYQKDGIIPPATIVYICTKCGDVDEKDVS